MRLRLDMRVSRIILPSPPRVATPEFCRWRNIRSAAAEERSRYVLVWCLLLSSAKQLISENRHASYRVRRESCLFSVSRRFKRVDGSLIRQAVTLTRIGNLTGRGPSIQWKLHLPRAWGDFLPVGRYGHTGIMRRAGEPCRYLHL